MAQTTWSRASVCLSGVLLILLHILGLKFPKNPNFGDIDRHLEAERPKYWSFILSKLQHWLQPNFAEAQGPSSCHRGQSQYAPNKSKIAAATSRQVLARFWWNFAQWYTSVPRIWCKVEVLIFESLIWQTAAILRIEKLLKYILQLHNYTNLAIKQQI